MPDTAFALSPLQSAMEAARARRAARLTAAQPAAEAPTLAPVEPQAAPGGAEASTIPSDFTPFEAAAVKHSVPINILQGVAEASGAGPDRADDIALRLAGPLSQGRSVPDAIASLFPDGKLPAGFIDTVRDRAKAIGKTYEQPAAAPESAPAPAEDNRSLVEKVIDPFGTTKELGKGLVRGVAGSISAGATSLGYDETAKSAADVAADPRLAPDVGSYRDVSGPQSAAKYVAGMAAESAPEMATVLTAAAGGGVVAGPAGAIGAGTATSAFFNTGRNVQRQAAEMPGQAPSYPRAIAAGLAQGGLDTLVPGHIVGAFGTRLLGALAEKGLMRAGTEVGADVLVEGVTEGTQQLIEMAQANPDLLRIMVNPNPDEAERSDQLLAEVADSVIGGAAIGGVFAGGAAALGGPGKHEAPGGAAAQETLPEADAPPAGPLEAALAQGPAPVASGFETGAKLDITNTDPETGEVINIPGTFVREDHTGVRIMDAEGTEHLIPRDEIESGATTLGPAVAPQEAPVDDTQPSEPVADDTQAPDATAPGELAAAAQAAIEPPAVPAREDRPAEPETPEEIETRLAYLREQRRSGGSLKRINREIADLTEKLAALQPEVDAPAADGYAPTSAGSAGVPAEAATPGPSDAPEPATITPSEIRTKAGAPFRSIGQAKQAIRARGFLPENFTIRPTDGGFVVVPHDAQVIDAQPVPSGTTDPAQTASAMSVEAGASAPAPEAPEGPGEPSAALMLPKPNSPRARREAKNGTGEAAFTEAASAPSGGEDAPVVSPEPAEGAVRAPEATAAAVQDAAATPKAEEIAAAAAEAHPNPSEAQAEAENHKVGRVKLHGLDISIETAKGNTRPGRDAPVAAHYGRILGTRGADGDHVDVYVGDHPDSARAFVIDQFDPESGAFDEKKTVLGANTADEATAIYDAGFSDGSGPERRRGAAPTEMSVDEFKAWLKDGDQSKPAQNTEGQAAPPAEAPQPAEPEAAGQKAGGQEEPPAAQFGPVFTEYRDDPEGAIARLMREKDGDARAAFIHPEVGPIDFVYGDEKKGLRHIEAKRGRAFVDRLPEILRNGAVVRRPEFKDRVYIVESADDPARVAAIRLDYDGREKVWLVTAFSDEKGGFVARREGTASFPPRTASPHIPDATGPDENNPSGAQDQAYGASNKLVSKERAAALRDRLKAKLRDQLNSGIDPEILAIGAELAVFHIEAGARRFLDLAKAISGDLGTTPAKLKPYLRSWYNGARDMLEDHGHSIEGMDDPQAVREALTQITEPVVQSEPESGGPSDDDDRGNAADDAEPLAEDLPPDGGEAVAEEADGREPGLRPVDADGDGHPEAGDGPVGAGSLGGGPDAVLPDREGAEPRPVGQGPIHRTEDKPAPLSGQSPGNFVITPDVGVGTGTNGEKIRANLAAIRILKALRAEHRFPTAEEQAAMARYVGWGGLKPVFDVKKTGASDMYGRAQAELREILTPDEYRAASASITDAHYTAPGVVEAMWRAARHFGFKGGRVLEPTVGVGNFIGLQPADMAASTEWHAAELDKITGGLAQMLYPEASILPGTGFEDAMFADGVFDLAIGNPPFGDWRVKDKHKVRKHLSGLKIHNYIIAKAGMHLRPGGIMQMVVTHRFLDTANPEARDVLAKDFRFLGAIRLPNDAFRANAGTEVTTDIIFLQKLGPSEKRDRAAAWLDVDGEIEGGIRVNRYFQENPQHILGRSAMDGSMYGGRRDEQGNGEYTVHSDGRDLGAAIDQILATDWKGLRNTLTDGPMTPPTAVMLSQSDLPVGGMMLDADGTIIRRAMDDAVGNSILEPITQDSFWKDLAAEWDRLAKAAAALKNGDIGSPMDLIDAARPVVLTAGGEKKSSPTQAEQAAYDLIDFAEKHGRYGNWQFDDHLAKIQKAAANRRLGVKGFAALRGLLDLRNRTLELIAAEQSDAPEIEDLRAGLNAAYDAYVQAHGYIGENIGVLDGDLGVEVGLEASYEPAIGDEAAKREGVQPRPAQATKSAILSKRINFPHKVITRADSVEDGLGVSLSERGKVDLPYIAGLVGKSVMEVTSELSRGAEPRIFLDPIADRYVDAEEYLSGNVKKKLAEAREAGLAKNAEALEKVLPEPLAQSRITPSLRGAWIPADVMQDFLTDLGVQGPVVRITPEIGRIVAEGGTGTPNALGAEFKDENATIVSIFNAAAQGKPITVRVKDGDKLVVDKDATRILGAKTERMQKVFAEWAYSEDGRAKRIVDAFNEKMNTHRPRTYDGVKYLLIPGASTEISLRRTQKNAAWRMVLSRNVLLDHVVGAGKTYTIIAGVMEKRRLGISRKPLIAVPNHLVVQWARDFYNLYPAAKILAATPADFSAKNRKRLLARIATGDFDAIVIGHTSLGFIETAPEDLTKVIDEKVEELENALRSMRANGESKRTQGQIEQKIKSYTNRLEEIAERPTDQIGVNLREMGVDDLTVDEMHEFKNLEYATSGERVVGMNDPNGSKKAFDLYAKVRGIQRRGGSVTGATGTPVSNSLVELFTVMSYFAHDDLAAQGVSHFDAWSGAYAVTETKLEYTATQKLKPRRVLASLTNLASLHQLYSAFADTITMATIKAMHAEDVAARNKALGTHERTEFPVPKVRDGGRVLRNGPITPQQSEFMDYLVARMNAIQAAGGKPEYMKIDNALWVLTDARKMSLDIRTVDPTAMRDENGKVMRAARSIKEIYDRWAEDRGTQLVFCDLSTPSKGAAKAAGKILTDAARVIWGDREGRARLKAMEAASFEDRWRWLNAQRDAAMENPNVSEEQRDRIDEHFARIEDADAAMSVADVGFSVYDDMRAVLSEMGIPSTEIAFIHDFETPAQKQKLFSRVNAGAIRVLMGSSQKMGAGTNAQERLVALHHMDAPWRPSDVEQREGRIIRQGNKLYQRDPDGFDVEINAYSTEGTSDTVMWQVLQRKAAGIEQFREGGIDAMDEDGGDSDQYAEFMASSTGNPVFRYNLEAERAATDAESQYGGRQIAKANATRFVEQYPRRKRALSDRVEAVAAATPGDLSYGGESGSIDDLTSAMSAARRAYEKAFAKYEEDMAAWGPIAEEATAKLAAEDAAGLPKKERTKVPPAPEKPTRPSMMSPSVLEKSGYARAVKAALEAISGKDFGEQVEIKMGAVDLLLEKQKRYNGDPVYALDVVIDGEGYSLGRSDARVPVNSPNMLAAFMPPNITERIERVGDSAGLDLKKMESRLPKEREMAGIEVSRDEVDAARELSRWYKAQVALAEVAADVKRGERPNRYIEGDTKRPLKGFSGEKEAPQDFEYAGDRYQGTGISAESGFGRRLYEATRQSDGAKAVVLKEAKQDGEIKDVMIEPKAAAERGEVKLARRGGPDSLASFEATQDILSRAADVISSLREQLGKLVPGIDLGVADKLFVFDRAGNEIAADGMLSTDGFIVMALDGQRDKGRTLGHEAIHALRAPAIWGTPFGLFREREWKVLERTATQRDGLMDAVRRDYPDLSPSEQLEEAVAELFGIWRTRGEAYGVARQAFERIASFLEALGNALRGHGFTTAASVMRRIESGDVGARGRSGKVGKPAAASAARTGGALAEVESDTVAASDWPAVERGLIGNAITKAMSGTTSLLALVPGRPLFAELAKAMPTAQEYLRLKGEMDALRSEWHGKTDTIAQRWRKILSANGPANKDFMDLMHEATLAGADPSRPFVYDIKGKDEEKRRRAHAALKARFDALPAPFKPLWGEIRDAYKALSDEFEATLLANVNKAMDVGLARAQRAHAETMQQAKDDGLKGAALASVKAATDKKLATAKLWSGWNKKARMADLRMKFETNKVSEPYFPLARFGDFFVTVRDKEDGHVVAFSKFESPAKQQAFAAEMRADGYSVEVGTIGTTKTRDMVDHGFVTDVENILQNAGVSDAVLDSVWQRWLETLPDFSIRKARIHRKGTPGFSPDAFRAFGHHMFHGAHQLARLRYSMDMQEALDLTKEAARHQPDPVRAGLVWQEMERRHEFTMSPKGAWWSQAISSAAFFFHLAFSPAAALVNLSQTTVIGIPVLAGFHGETARGTAIASRELGRALIDFTSGKGHAVESDRLTADEKAALTEAYRRGTIDASQAHDLAGVAESGVEYSDLRTKWMGRMSWFFHHAERLNREVTFLAAYRMARAKGLEEHAAIDKASDLTWRIHFDYQSSSKPRVMQGDTAKALLTFKNYSANMIWRLVRDTHQALHGASPEERREALHQLGGITASMALHAGIRGTWLYSLAMMLVGLLFGGGSDEAEEELQRGAVNLLGRQGAALVLNGIPGALTGTDLTERIGMPDLWFRSPDRPLEGKDLYLYWVEQMLGAGFGVIANQFVGADLIRQGNVERGIETMMPKVVKDAMRAYRYATDGVQTMKGDPILEDADPSVALKQILGFTPAEIAERYEANSRMKNREQRIEEERSDIVKEFVAALRDGGKPTAEMIARRDRFNAENPDYPIVGSTIRRSLSGKIQASRRQEFGASLNPRLNDRIRREAAPLLTGE